MSIEGNKRPSFAEFMFQKLCPTNKFLDEMDEVIPWVEIQKFFDKRLKIRSSVRIGGKKIGRPSYPTMLMFRIHLLQQWYDLSDAQAEYQIYDRWQRPLPYVLSAF